MKCELCTKEAEIVVTYQRDPFELFDRSFAGFEFQVATCKGHRIMAQEIILGSLKARFNWKKIE